MTSKTNDEQSSKSEVERRSYAAPALEKGLDILEILCRSERPMSQKEIAKALDRSTGEIYRMVACLVDRNYVSQVDDNSYTITTKLYELAHINPPTHRLLFEAMPVMQRLAKELEQSCHLTVYSQGKQVVLAKVDAPSGMGFSVRTGSELDVLISASGRVLLAFQDAETTRLWIEESVQHRPQQSDPQIGTILEAIRKIGFGMGAYDATKAGVLALTRTTAFEEGEHGVRANSICPGFTKTVFHVKRMGEEAVNALVPPCVLQRWAEPSELAYPMLWLASDEASYVTGSTFMIDGGLPA